MRYHVYVILNVDRNGIQNVKCVSSNGINVYAYLLEKIGLLQDRIVERKKKGKKNDFPF